MINATETEWDRVYVARTVRPERYLQPCRVLPSRQGRAKVLLMFPDGCVLRASAGHVRRPGAQVDLEQWLATRGTG